jgi:hypothetical protein
VVLSRDRGEVSVPKLPTHCIYHGIAIHYSENQTEREGAPHSDPVRTSRRLSLHHFFLFSHFHTILNPFQSIFFAFVVPELTSQSPLVCRGLDNAGKTTCVKKFNGEDVNTISPTLGFDIKTLEYNGYAISSQPCPSLLARTYYIIPFIFNSLF